MSDQAIPTIPAELLAAASQSDSQIRQDAARIVAKVFHDLEYQMDHGTPANRLLVQQKILPILMKQLEDDKTSDELIRLREEVTMMRREVAEALLGEYALELEPEE